MLGVEYLDVVIVGVGRATGPGGKGGDGGWSSDGGKG